MVTPSKQHYVINEEIYGLVYSMEESCFMTHKKKYFNKFFQKNTQIKMSVHFFEDKEGIIWVGTSNGIFSNRKRYKKIIQHTHVTDNLVRSVIKDKKTRYG